MQKSMQVSIDRRKILHGLERANHDRMKKFEKKRESLGNFDKSIRNREHKMIYVNANGRLGNQMFYYAIARKIQVITKHNHEIAINFNSIYEKGKDTKDSGWEDSLKFFRTVHYEAINEDTMQMIYHSATSLQRKYYFVGYYFYKRIAKKLPRKPYCYIAEVADRFFSHRGGYFLTQWS